MNYIYWICVVILLAALSGCIYGAVVTTGQGRVFVLVVPTGLTFAFLGALLWFGYATTKEAREMKLTKA